MRDGTFLWRELPVVERVPTGETLVLSAPQRAEMLLAFPLRHSVTGEDQGLGGGPRGRRRGLASPDPTGARTGEGRGAA